MVCILSGYFVSGIVVTFLLIWSEDNVSELDTVERAYSLPRSVASLFFLSLEHSRIICQGSMLLWVTMSGFMQQKEGLPAVGCGYSCVCTVRLLPVLFSGAEITLLICLMLSSCESVSAYCMLK